MSAARVADGVLWLEVSQEMLRQAEATPAAAKGLVNFMSTFDGPCVTAVFRELESHQVEISLRSRPSVDVSGVALAFGGGGHPQAAGVPSPAASPTYAKRCWPLCKWPCWNNWAAVRVLDADGTAPLAAMPPYPEALVIGVLNIDKPAGWTSHDVVARIRRLAGERRVGHAGTLDPMATGVLVVCLGAATRLVEYLADLDKSYRATIRFGAVTDTWDAEGEVIATADTADLTLAAAESALAAFRGTIEQTPPMYSALKRDGRPLYELARQGVTVEREARLVEISRLEIISWAPPDLVVDITCSKGTYVRAIAHDLGAALGVGAHLAALARTRVGSFTLDSAVPPEAITSGDAGALLAALRPAAAAVGHLPAVTLTPDEAALVRQGRTVDLSPAALPPAVPADPPETLRLAALDEGGDLVAVLLPVCSEAAPGGPTRSCLPPRDGDPCPWKSATHLPLDHAVGETVLTIGTFDGVHRGHQHLLRQVAARARQTGRTSAAISFHPHPRAVLRPESSPTYLSLPAERAALVEALGIDLFVVLPFTTNWPSARPAISCSGCAPISTCVNCGWALTLPWPAAARAMCPACANWPASAATTCRSCHPCRMRAAPSAAVASAPCSWRARWPRPPTSWAPLRRLWRGHSRLCPRPQPRLRTANVAPPAERLLPPDGVYAVWAEVDGRRLPGVANVGIRPSFDAGRRLIETHLLDYDGDLYGHDMTVAFAHYLRPELRFEQPAALVAQVQADMAAARRLLSQANATE
jgi:tRNA pseudouridine55 synthase